MTPRGSHGNSQVHLAVHLVLSAGRFGNPSSFTSQFAPSVHDFDVHTDFLQPCSSETFACIFSWRRQHHHRSVRDSMAAAMFSTIFCVTTFASQRVWATCSWTQNFAPLLRDLRKSQTNLSFKPLVRKSAFSKLAHDHRQTWSFDDEDVENVAVDAGIRLGEGVLMLLRIRSHICCSKLVPFALVTHSPSVGEF